MAKYEAGINGPFSGKIGNVVGALWKGIPYMRSLPKKRTGKVSEAEMANRAKFALAQEWLKPLTPFLRVGFCGYKERMEGFVAAKSYLLKEVMEKGESDFMIKPEKMLVSYGTLKIPEEASASIQNGNQLTFTWKPETDRLNALDQALLLAYVIDEHKAIFSTLGEFRKTGRDSLSLTNDFKGHKMEVYLAFVAADRSKQSNSVHLGSILWNDVDS